MHPVQAVTEIALGLTLVGFVLWLVTYGPQILDNRYKMAHARKCDGCSHQPYDKPKPRISLNPMNWRFTDEDRIRAKGFGVEL